MAFRRPHPRQRRTCEEYKAELEEENYHLRSELQTEVDIIARMRDELINWNGIIPDVNRKSKISIGK